MSDLVQRTQSTLHPWAAAARAVRSSSRMHSPRGSTRGLQCTPAPISAPGARCRWNSIKLGYTETMGLPVSAASKRALPAAHNTTLSCNVTLQYHAGALLLEEKYAHKYPFDWRTKMPTI